MKFHIWCCTYTFSTIFIHKLPHIHTMYDVHIFHEIHTWKFHIYIWFSTIFTYTYIFSESDVATFHTKKIPKNQLVLNPPTGSQRISAPAHSSRNKSKILLSSESMAQMTGIGWRRTSGCLIRKRATHYRTLLREMTCKIFWVPSQWHKWRVQRGEEPQDALSLHVISRTRVL